MEIKNVTELSSLQLANISMSKQKKLKRSRQTWFFLLLLYFLLIIYKLGKSEVINVYENLPLYVIFLGIVIYLFILRPFIIKKKYKEIFGEQGVKYNYLFKDDEIKFELFSTLTKEEHVTYSYDTINEIDFMDGYIILYMTPRTIFLTIDKKGFDSESEMDEVLANIKNKMKKPGAGDYFVSKGN